MVAITTAIERLAAGYGDDVRVQVARRQVANSFFETIFEREQDWHWVRRALETVDFSQPVMIGPAPPLPKRLTEIFTAALGRGFYTETGRSATSPGLRPIAPDAAYLKWFAPYARGDAGGDGRVGPGDARYFVPAVRFQEAAASLTPVMPR
jgi:hypothetical protein